MARRPKPWYRKSRKAWFVTLEGVQHNLGPNKSEAYETFYQLMREPRPKKVSPQSVIVLIDEFLEWTQKHRSPETYEWYRYRLQRFSERHPDLRISELRPFHVQKWVDSYSLSKTSRRNYLRSVKRCLAWAEKQGYVERSPIAHLEVPNADRKEIFVTDAEWDRLLKNIPDPAFRDLVVLSWETGCRPQESLRVEARHVDLKRQRWVFPKNEAKGERFPRIVYLTESAVEITKRLSERYPEGPLFRNSQGRPWTTDAANCAFDRVRIRLAKEKFRHLGLSVSAEEIEQIIPNLKTTKISKGKKIQKTKADLQSEAKRKLIAQKAVELVPRYSLYALRHSWATRALQAGVDALTVAVLMGHSDPSTLAKCYQHLSLNPEHLLDQARRVTGKG